MAAVIVVLAWVCMMTGGCLLGAHQAEDQAHNVIEVQRLYINAASRRLDDVRVAADNTNKAYSRLVASIADDIDMSGIDGLLSALPQGSYRNSIVSCYDMPRPAVDHVPGGAVPDPRGDVAALRFNQVRVYYGKDEYSCWRRGAWVLVPAGFFDKVV